MSARQGAQAAAFVQLSLFDREERLKATNLFDKTEYQTKDMTGWMSRLVPDGVCYVMVGEHPCVLRRTKMAHSDVREGMEYLHYLMGGSVYSGVFVGEEGRQ